MGSSVGPLRKRVAAREDENESGEVDSQAGGETASSRWRFLPPGPPETLPGAGKGKNILKHPFFTLPRSTDRTTTSISSRLETTPTATASVAATATTPSVSTSTSAAVETLVSTADSPSPTEREISAPVTSSLLDSYPAVLPSTTLSTVTRFQTLISTRDIPGPGTTRPPTQAEVSQTGRLNPHQTAGIVVGALCKFPRLACEINLRTHLLTLIQVGLILLLALVLFAVKKWMVRRWRSTEAPAMAQPHRRESWNGSTYRRIDGPLFGLRQELDAGPATRQDPDTAVTRPAPSATRWLAQLRRTAPAPAPHAEEREASNEGHKRNSARVSRTLSRHIISTMMLNRHTPASISPPVGSEGRSTPSADGRLSGARHRQSVMSDMSMWTTSVTENTDSGTFVPTTPLTVPKFPSGSQRVAAARAPAWNHLAQESRKSVRFSTPGAP